MLASVQIADLGAVGSLRALLRGPKPSSTPGLRWASPALAAPLALSGPPPIKRAALLAFWDDEEAFERFAADDPIGRRFSGGFHARLQPLRAHGSWPGLPTDLPTGRDTPAHEGPVVVLTLGRLRISQTVRFLRTSRPAERAVAEAKGMIWGTASARPPFVATISIWESAKASATYAFGRQVPAHSDAIAEQARKDFHKESAFIRFAPLRMEGSLAGKNPLEAASILA